MQNQNSKLFAETKAVPPSPKTEEPPKKQFAPKVEKEAPQQAPPRPVQNKETPLLKKQLFSTASFGQFFSPKAKTDVSQKKPSKPIPESKKSNGFSYKKVEPLKKENVKNVVSPDKHAKSKTVIQGFGLKQSKVPKKEIISEPPPEKKFSLFSSVEIVRKKKQG